MKKTSHSTELLTLRRDISALIIIINNKKNALTDKALRSTPYDAEIEKDFTILGVALQYRYTLGLYNTNKTFFEYYKRNHLVLYLQ